MKKISGKLLSITAASLISGSAFAVPFSEIRIGDVDGFGYDADANFASLSGDGGSVDRNGDGYLGIGDVLPSLNGDAVVATGSSDNFDNRMGESVTGAGFVDRGTMGVEFTDISLSTSYDNASAAGRVYNANTSSFGAGGAFPLPPSSSLPNQPGFTFDFFVADGDIAVGTNIFFNMVFGDYDVTPASLDFGYVSGMETISVTPQNNGPDDGLIQGAYAELDFSKVFTYSAADNGWYGFLTVDFNAPREPYTAFDYVELSVEPLVVAVPEPGALFMLAGVFGLVALRRRAKAH